jgi:hypothetical protein
MVMRFKGLTPGYNQQEVFVDVHMNKESFMVVHTSFGSISTIVVNGKDTITVTSASLTITSL